MKIDDQFSTSSDVRAPSIGRTQETRPEERTNRRNETAGSDSAGISSLSVELSRALNREEPQQAARIERLQEAVANGSYSVSSQDVASRIVGAAVKER